MFKINDVINKAKKKSLVVTYFFNQRTALGCGLTILRLCFLTGDTVMGGLGSQREGLSGMLSLALALNSQMAL